MIAKHGTVIMTVLAYVALMSSLALAIVVS
jgi:hypothetical protein